MGGQTSQLADVLEDLNLALFVVFVIEFVVRVVVLGFTNYLWNGWNQVGVHMPCTGRGCRWVN